MFANPFTRHVYVFLVSLTCIITIVTVKNYEIAGQNCNYTNDRSSNSKKNVAFQSGRRALNTTRRYENYMSNIEFKRKETGKLKHIYFLGLFELSTKFGMREESFSETSAALLAIKHVNERQILPGYVLKLLINNTKCDPGVGIDSFFHALYSNKTILMLLGSGCSNVTESIANIVPYWNILQVSFGSLSPTLSDRNKFPLFFRTAMPDSSHNPARLAFIKYFKWNTVATFIQSENTFLLPLYNLGTILENENITCSVAVTFSLENYREQLRLLKALDTRIIIGSFSARLASKIFCEVFTLEMYGADYVWILHELQDFWWENGKDCDVDNLKKVVEGIVIISEHNVIADNATTISGLNNEMFEELLNTTSKSKYTRHTYDAVWAMALALRTARECGVMLNEFNYKREDMVKKIIYAMGNSNFMGVSGPITFIGADRIGNTVFKQIQGQKRQTIAIFYANENFLDFNCKQCKEIKWQGDQVPIAQRVFKIRLVTIPKPAFYTVLIISSLGVSICLVFLYFSLHFRRIKALKLSSPKLNNIAVIGCILVYIAVILLGIDKETLSEEKYFSQLCTARIYLLSAGFSLAFGSMFAKTYRVHRIFTYSCTGPLKDKILKDKQLIASISLLLLIDALIVTFWVFVDPLRRQLYNLTAEISLEDRGVVYQPQVEVCACNNTRGWFLVIYGYKGCLLLMGLYMAWETRKIQIQALNDSQYIGICVYSTVSSTIVVILSNYLSENAIINYLATTSSILISTTLSLFLLFLPKLRAVFGHVDEGDPVMESMGLKFESNTRRLVAIDPNERTYRMEIQNRVYRCELDALDREIARLEALLSKSPSRSSQPIHQTVPKNLLHVPCTNMNRASWPTCHNLTIPLSTENRSNDENFEKARIFDRLKAFLGSIQSVPQVDENVDGLLDAAKKGKPTSNPEFHTNSLICDRKMFKARSTVSIISRNETNICNKAEVVNTTNKERRNVY